MGELELSGGISQHVGAPASARETPLTPEGAGVRVAWAAGGEPRVSLKWVGVF